MIFSIWPIMNLTFVNLIPVAEQCSSTARIGPHHCGHRTGAVLSSDKHWHAVLEHFSATAIKLANAGNSHSLDNLPLRFVTGIHPG